MQVKLDDAGLQALQVVRLKRSVPTPELVALAGLDGDAAIARLLDAGLLEVSADRLSATDSGEATRREALGAERTRLDAAALAAAYRDFERHNAELKEIVTAWQLRGDLEGSPPNDHTDFAYDAAVVGRLWHLHQDFTPVLEEIVALVPRLGAYQPRLAAALARVEAGEGKYLASPLIDSYHTAWFELHEELFDAQGLDRRAAEAQAE